MSRLLSLILVLSVFTCSDQGADGSDATKLHGVVVPAVEAAIVSQVTGGIAAVHVSEGDRVKQGDVLVEINPHAATRNQIQRRTELKAAILEGEAAKIALDIANVSLEAIETKLKRLEDRAVESRPQTRLQLAELRSESKIASLRVSLAEIQLKRQEALKQIAQSRWEDAEHTLSQTRIVAPFDAVVASVQERGSAIAHTTPVVTLFSPAWEVGFGVSPRQAEALKSGSSTASVAVSGINIPVELVSVSPRVDKGQKLQVRVRPNASHDIDVSPIPGMLVDVVLKPRD